MSSLNAPLVDHVHAPSESGHHAHDTHTNNHTLHHIVPPPQLDTHSQAREARIRSELRHASKNEPQPSHHQPTHVPPQYTSCYLTTLTVIRTTAALSLLAIAGLTIECIHQTVVHRPTQAAPDWFTAVLALIFHFFTALVVCAALVQWPRALMRRLALLGSYLFCGLSLCYLAVLVLSNVTVEGRFDVWLVDVLRVVCSIVFFIGLLLAVLGCIGGEGMEARRRARIEEERREREEMV